MNGFLYCLVSTVAQLVHTHFFTCMHSSEAAGYVCTLKCMQPPPLRCKDNGKFTQIPYSTAANSKPPCTFDCTPHTVACPCCTPYASVVHPPPRTPLLMALIPAERAEICDGLAGARLRLYDILHPQLLTPVLRVSRASTLPCFRASPPPHFPARPPPLSWPRVVLRPHGPESATLPYCIRRAENVTDESIYLATRFDMAQQANTMSPFFHLILVIKIWYIKTYFDIPLIVVTFFSLLSCHISREMVKG